jgi:16S rRNA (guanine527-N7)-methyltransferase
MGLALDEATQRQLLDYVALLLKWNRVYNLTALRTPHEAITHHVLDSLSLLPPLLRHTQGRPTRVLDVGSGGGLPGVVLAICRPELDVTCVDAVAKKAAFIQQVAGALSLSHLHGVHARVEDLKQTWPVITSRAFASLADFTTWSSSALAPEGLWWP